MNQFLKKTVLIGVGIYSKAQKEMEKALSDLVKNNKITRKEGEAMLGKFINDSKKFEKDLSSQIKKESSDFASRVKKAHGKEIESLKKKLSVLEKKARSKVADGGRKFARYVEGSPNKKAKSSKKK